MEPIDAPLTRPQFSLWQTVVAMCVLGAAGGLLVRYVDGIEDASSRVLFWLMCYGSVIVALMATLFVAVRIYRDQSCPVSAGLFLVACGLALMAFLTGGMPLELSGGCVLFVLATVAGGWVEIIVCRVWKEQWTTALAMTVAVVSWGLVSAMIMLSAAG